MNKIYIHILIYIFIIIFLTIRISVKKDIKTFLLSGSTIVILTVIFSFYVNYRFTLPIIYINGDSMVEIDVFDEYIDEGYSISHPNSNLRVSVESNVDTSKVGTYNVKYIIDYYGREISKIRKVKVVDLDKPLIELNGKSEITLVNGSKYEEEGYIATDNYDGDITDSVVVTDNIKEEAGNYEITYIVTDSSGNSHSVKRMVNRVIRNDGFIYLTFDDGPSSTTSEVLDILKEENVKATFFVVNYSDYYATTIKRIVEEGHTIALHSYTHNYKYIYSSVDSYFEDLLKLKEKVKNTTGIDTKIIRFPGGTSNTISSFNKGIMTTLVKKVKERGFIYFDWNVDSRDAGGAKTSTDVYNNVMNNLKINRNNVVLMHDFGNNKKTIDALSMIIKDAKNRGYTFDKITNNTTLVVHSVNN